MKQHYKQSPQCLEGDIELALALLEGAPRFDRRGLPKFVPLSATTKPTEREARAALCRVLLSIADDYPKEDKRSKLFAPLISLFSPPIRMPPSIVRPSPFKATLKRYNQGHDEPWRDFVIAREVHNLSSQLGPRGKNKAISEAAKKFGLDERHIKKICARWQTRWQAQGGIRAGKHKVASDR
jgi:hypothetical protein